MKCPFCEELINDDADYCKYCSETITEKGDEMKKKGEIKLEKKPVKIKKKQKKYSEKQENIKVQKDPNIRLFFLFLILGLIVPMTSYEVFQNGIISIILTGYTWASLANILKGQKIGLDMAIIYFIIQIIVSFAAYPKYLFEPAFFAFFGGIIWIVICMYLKKHYYFNKDS